MLPSFFIIMSGRHEEQLAEVEKRWLEQVEGLKKSQETLELERHVHVSRVRLMCTSPTILLP